MVIFRELFRSLNDKKHKTNNNKKILPKTGVLNSSLHCTKGYKLRKKIEKSEIKKLRNVKPTQTRTEGLWLLQEFESTNFFIENIHRFLLHPLTNSLLNLNMVQPRPG